MTTSGLAPPFFWERQYHWEGPPQEGIFSADPNQSRPLGEGDDNDTLAEVDPLDTLIEDDGSAFGEVDTHDPDLDMPMEAGELAEP